MLVNVSKVIQITPGVCEEYSASSRATPVTTWPLRRYCSQPLPVLCEELRAPVVLYTFSLEFWRPLIHDFNVLPYCEVYICHLICCIMGVID